MRQRGRDLAVERPIPGLQKVSLERIRPRFGEKHLRDRGRARTLPCRDSDHQRGQIAGPGNKLLVAIERGKAEIQGGGLLFRVRDKCPRLVAVKGG